MIIASVNSVCSLAWLSVLVTASLTNGTLFLVAFNMITGESEIYVCLK
jgi:hypothetical protein